jgi:hypothetical protein
LEGVSREIGFAGVKLAPFARAHNLTGVSNRSRLVEALVEYVAYEGAWRRVVATHARMDFSEELAPLGMGMHRCKTLVAVHLYNSPSMRVNDLAILAMRLASDRTEGSSLDPSR